MQFFTEAKKQPEPVQKLFYEGLKENHANVDKIFLGLLLAQWIFGVVCAFTISPTAWNGGESEVHIHVGASVLLGGLIVLPAVLLAKRCPGQLVTRQFIATAQLLFSGLLIHLMGGRIEAHFHVFVSLAILSAYRDRSVFIPAVAVTAIYHIIRGFVWPQSVFGVLTVVPWRPFEHAGWVLFEVICLSFLIKQSLRQMLKLASMQCSLLTERDQLEVRVLQRTAELNDAKLFQETILNSIEAEVCILNGSGEILYVNERWEAFSRQNGGDPSKTGVGVNYIDQCLKDGGLYETESKKLAQAIRQIANGELQTYSTEYPCNSPNKKRWFHVSVNRVPLFGQQAVSLIHVDVTAMKVAQDRSASFAKMIMESPNELFIFDRETFMFVEVNQGAMGNLGYSREELLEMSPADIKPDYNEGQLLEMFGDLLTGERSVIKFETRHERKDGTVYPCSISLHLSQLEEREVFVAFVTDITDQKKLESDLHQARKLESVGQLAAGVAHEINTPMQCVFGNVEFLEGSFQKLLGLSDRVVEMLEEFDVDWEEEREELSELRRKFRYDYLREQTPHAIKEAADASSRVISIIRAMKIMSHPGTAKKAPTDIQDMLENAATITRSRWKSCAELRCEFTDDMADVMVLPAEISQVFINMIVNAADAITEKIGDEPTELGQILISTEIDGDYAVIKFKDSGAGIPAEVLERVFDPFFTTKEVGKGTGQGLAISHDVIVNKHSGKISVETEPGEGTEFQIRLPRFDEPEAETSKLESSEIPALSADSVIGSSYMPASN